MESHQSEYRNKGLKCWKIDGFREILFFASMGPTHNFGFFIPTKNDNFEEKFKVEIFVKLLKFSTKILFFRFPKRKVGRVRPRLPAPRRVFPMPRLPAPRLPDAHLVRIPHVSV